MKRMHQVDFIIDEGCTSLTNYTDYHHYSRQLIRATKRQQSKNGLLTLAFFFLNFQILKTITGATECLPMRRLLHHKEGLMMCLLKCLLKVTMTPLVIITPPLEDVDQSQPTVAAPPAVALAAQLSTVTGVIEVPSMALMLMLVPPAVLLVPPAPHRPQPQLLQLKNLHPLPHPPPHPPLRASTVAVLRPLCQ